MAIFEKIGGMLGLAFYAAQAVALVGGLVAFAAGGRAAGDAWLAWTMPLMVAVSLALVVGMPAVGALQVFWRLVTDAKYGNE